MRKIKNRDFIEKNANIIIQRLVSKSLIYALIIFNIKRTILYFVTGPFDQIYHFLNYNSVGRYIL